MSCRPGFAGSACCIDKKRLVMRLKVSAHRYGLLGIFFSFSIAIILVIGKMSVTFSNKKVVLLRSLEVLAVPAWT